ncbi:MAG: glycosyl hydrolase family 18 protein [Coxiellaceae bacterium]|nr:glycosyl hydrolase family 18 protein [Coxiellaceae bacterium]
MIRIFLERFIFLFVIFFTIIFPISSSAFEILGYMYRNDSVSHLESDTIFRQDTSLKNNIKHINIVSPQAYQVDSKGMLWGTVDPMILQLASQNHVKVMPMVTNAGFDSLQTQVFLKDEKAQDHVISEIRNVCKKFHYAGIQIDFEHVLFLDKNDFSVFYQKLSDDLHKNGFLISVAILPRTTDKTPTSTSGKYCLENWNGAYDYAVLGKASDFVTLMAYDQHSSGTTPGSACEPSWAERIIVYALNYIPPAKISLGVPVHSSYWYTDFRKRSKHVEEADLTYAQTDYLMKKYHAPFVWDKKSDVPYAIYNNNNFNNYIFPQNVATFKILLDMAKKYHLRGISIWCLGYEDPKIWSLL